MKKNILITGASGFLGKRLLDKLHSLSDKYQTLAGALHNEAKIFQHLDLSNIEESEKTIKAFKPDIVFHLAANVDLSRDFDVAKKCIDTNITGTLNLLEILRPNPPEKLLFASTEEVYGDGTLPFQENQLPHPPSAYSMSKIASENLCNIFAQETECSLYIFRIATFYGPGAELHRFIPKLIISALKNEQILLNSGTKKRDYIYIDDVIDALMHALEQKKVKNELLNLGGGKSYSLRYVVDKIISLTKSHSDIVLNAFPDRSREAEEWLMNIEKAKKSLEWEPKASLEKGLQQTIDYFKKNYL